MLLKQPFPQTEYRFMEPKRLKVLQDGKRIYINDLYEYPKAALGRK